jgi:hypothetical protein
MRTKKCKQFKTIFVKNLEKPYTYTGYFTTDNEPDKIENATHNTFVKLT